MHIWTTKFQSSHKLILDILNMKEFYYNKYHSGILYYLQMVEMS